MNNVLIDLASGSYVISDSGATIVPGAGVTLVSANVATIPAAGITGIEVRLSDGNDVILLTSNIVIPSSLQGDDGDDSITGGAGDDVIRGGLGTNTIDGGDGFDRLVANTEFNAGLNDTELITSEGERDNFGNIELVNIRGSAGPNDIEASLTTGIFAYDLEGYDGDDILRIGVGSGVVRAGNGFDRVIVRGLADSVITDTTVSVGTGSNTILAVELVNVRDSDDGHVLDASATTGLFEIQLEGNGGDDTLISGRSGNTALSGKDGNDTYVISDNWGFVSISDLVVDADNVLDLSDVTSNLAIQIEIIGGSILDATDGVNDINFSSGGRILTIKSGSGNDTVVGTDADTNWLIQSENAGRAGSFSFFNVENIVGGAGNDLFIFSGVGRLTGGVDGAAGFDVLDWEVSTATPSYSVTGNGTVDGNHGSSSTLGTGFDNINSFRLPIPGLDPCDSIALAPTDSNTFGPDYSPVAMDGETIVVGSPSNMELPIYAGAAYVFERNQGGVGNWGQVKKLLATDGNSLDQLGYTVAISGDIIAAGAPFDSLFGTTQTPDGSVYLFSRNQGGAKQWGQVKKLVAPDSIISGAFGGTLAISGDTLAIVGREVAFDNGVYIFERNFGGTDNWGFVKKLTRADGSPLGFGYSAVGIDGDNLVFGSDLFRRDEGGPNNWGFVKNLHPGGGYFGGATPAISGDAIAIATIHDSHPGGADGSVYLFSRDAGGPDNWGLVKVLYEENGMGDLRETFGWSVSLKNDRLAVGMIYEADFAYLGSVHIFERHEGGNDNWGRTAKLRSPDANGESGFGYQVGISSTAVVVNQRYVIPQGASEINVFECNPVSPNSPPTISGIGGPIGPLSLGSVASVSVSFTDEPDQSHTTTIDWGDGTTSFANSPPSTFLANLSHTYAGPGVYRIAVTVEDPLGASDAEVFELIVIYDPEGGFVTGGGWINSPLGAYTPDPSLTGRANFGFVSKYKKGASVPTGQTQFQFKAGNLSFHSSSYDWLVVAGRKAMYTGTGRVNGVDGYRFRLNAIDGHVTGGDGIDRFRIKIWNATGGGVIYDNQLGVDESADPTTALGGGNIVIHKN